MARPEGRQPLPTPNKKGTMNSLGDYFGELAKREGKSSLKLAARWARTEIRSITRCLRNAFARCHFEQEPLVVNANVTGQALGNKLASHFATKLGQELKLFKIQSCGGQGYPDRRLVRVSDRRSFPLELKATTAFEPTSTNRVILTCSSGKLRRHFISPINHLLLTVIHNRKGKSVWIKNFRADFLEPWSKVRVRLEASVSQHLLTKDFHASFWCKPENIDASKKPQRRNCPQRKTGCGRTRQNLRKREKGPPVKASESARCPRRISHPKIGAPSDGQNAKPLRKVAASYAENGKTKISPYLSKSDFKVARTCPAKLYYKKLGYPTVFDDDPYMALLADGGFMVGKLAQLHYPEGILVSTLDPRAAVEETKRLMQRENVTIFEAAIYHQNRLVRIDVLRKRGNELDLIEVKSKAADSNENRAGTLFTRAKGGIRSEWRKYLEDVAYQAAVLRAAYPHASVRRFLLAPDKAKTARIDGLCQRFRIRHCGNIVNVDVVGDPEELRGEDILTVFPVDDQVTMLGPEVESEAKRFLTGLIPNFVKLPSKIGYECRNCEYRVHEGVTKSGFAECWKSLATIKPHVFDLYQLRQAKGTDGQPIVNELIEQGKASLFDVPLSVCSSAHGPRQIVQLKHTRSGEEWFAPTLKEKLARLKGPLHFIDFETSTMALPYHRGMRPFELVAFQWSCHTLKAPGTEPAHREWINFDQVYPNIEFANSLRETIGDRGVLMTWSAHERTTLQLIAEKIEDYFPEKNDLAAWLRGLTVGDRIVDMCALAKEGYFHPEMKGSLSIKYVLPAIWRSHPELHKVPWFKKYHAMADGHTLSPYDTLPALPIAGKEELVNEGTGAMRAYQAMLYGEEGADPKAKHQWKRLLLQYCELDTMAMVMIFEHWWRTVMK